MPAKRGAKWEIKKRAARLFGQPFSTAENAEPAEIMQAFLGVLSGLRSEKCDRTDFVKVMRFRQNQIDNFAKAVYNAAHESVCDHPSP